MVTMEKRSQAERMAIVETILTEINAEMCDGRVEDILQSADYCQVEINRILFILMRDQCLPEKLKTATPGEKIHDITISSRIDKTT